MFSAILPSPVFSVPDCREEKNPQIGKNKVLAKLVNW